MKKFTSIFTAVIMVLAVIGLSVLPAFASVKDYTQNYLDYTDGSKYYVRTEYSKDENCYVYRYDGGGIVTNWEFVGLKEGVDYEVYAMGEAHIAIRYIAEKKDFSDINLTVNFDRWQTALYVQDITVYVNGLRNFGEIHNEFGEVADSLKYTYSGKGSVVDWELPNLTEGVHYEVLKKEGNSITLKLINGQNEIPYLNVFVDFGKSDKGTDFGLEDTVPVNIKVESPASSAPVKETEKSPGTADGDKEADNAQNTSAPADKTENLPSTDDSEKEIEASPAPSEKNDIADNAESSPQNTVIICVAVGVCSAAAAGVIVVAAMKKKKS